VQRLAKNTTKPCFRSFRSSGSLRTKTIANTSLQRIFDNPGRHILLQQYKENCQSLFTPSSRDWPKGFVMSDSVAIKVVPADLFQNAACGRGISQVVMGERSNIEVLDAISALHLL
jgi:hypothetical protein